MFIYFEREKQHMSRGGTEREAASKENPRLRAVSTELDVGLELTNREILT